MPENETYDWKGTQRDYTNRLDWTVTVVLYKDDEKIVIYDEYGNRWDTYIRKTFPRVYENATRILRKKMNV